MCMCVLQTEAYTWRHDIVIFMCAPFLLEVREGELFVLECRQCCGLRLGQPGPPLVVCRTPS